MNAIFNEVQLIIDEYTIKGETLVFDVDCWAQIAQWGASVLTYIWVYDNQTSHCEDCGHGITKDTEVHQLKDSFSYCFKILLPKRLDRLNTSDNLLTDSIDETLLLDWEC